MKFSVYGSGAFVCATMLTVEGFAQTNPAPNTFSTEVSLRAPAVSQLNGKVSYAGGGMNSDDGHNFDGSISLPVGQQFGFQGDALYSRIASENFYGGAGHLFWRRPELGLVGITGGYLTGENVATFQVGAEGEYYLDSFTFGLFAGIGSINYSTTAPFIDTNPTKFIAHVSADWYALDDLRVGASYTTAFDNSLVKGEVEYLTPLDGLALTAEVAAGDHGYDHWLLGIRYYFGSKKSLRERHRQDDPRSLMPQILHALGAYGAEFNRNGKTYFATHPETGSWGGSSYGLIVIDSMGSGPNVIGNGLDLLPPGNPPINGGPGNPGH